jgi:hypothetical protein
MGLLHKLSSIRHENLEALITMQTVAGSIPPDTEPELKGNRFPDGVYHNAPSAYPLILVGPAAAICSEEMRNRI